MAINQNVSLFTTKIRDEFYRSYAATAKPAPYERVTQVIPSSARIEHFHWMSPVPAIALYKGNRNFGKVGTILYSTQNVEFSSGFQVELRDVEDLQTGGYELSAQQLSDKARAFPSRWVLQHLANGATLTGFDGTAFFADSHTIGSGDNLLTQTATGDALGGTYKLVALHTGGRLKPLLWQNRKAPSLMTDAGTPQSSMAKKIRYWLDMEGQAAFGYWWDAIQITFTNLPNVQDLHTAFATIERTFRTFSLPTGLANEPLEYPHEQTEFSEANLCLVGSTALADPLRTALNQSWSPYAPVNGAVTNSVAVTNRYQGFASWFVTRFLDSDVTVSTEGH